MNFKTRRALLEDAPAITELLNGLEWFTQAGGIAEIRLHRHLELCLADDSHSVYVADTGDGDMVGYIAVHWLPYLFLPGPEGYVSELFVRESARGQGLGSQLLAVVKTEAKTRGCARLALVNNRGRESYRRGFYKKQGWQERESLAVYIQWLDEA